MEPHSCSDLVQDPVLKKSSYLRECPWMRNAVMEAGSSLYERRKKAHKEEKEVTSPNLSKAFS